MKKYFAVLACSILLSCSPGKLTVSSDVVPGAQSFGLFTQTGSSAEDICNDIAVDGSGNVYCAGSTQGNFDETNGGGTDAFIIKFNASGAVQWITQLGATTKSAGGSNTGNDVCNGIALDSAGNIFCAGTTTGAMGEANGGGNDVFIMKLNSAGTLQWVKQLGGTTVAAGGSNTGNDYCNDIAIDSTDNIYCAGVTTGGLGEANGGGGDPFILKFNPAGVLQWVSQLGGTTYVPGGDNSGYAACNGIGIDGTGNIYCGGSANGDLAEVRGGSNDMFILKFNSVGALQWGTQLGSVTKVPGGSNASNDQCYSLAIDTAGNAFCGGVTEGAMAEAHVNYQDAVVAKVDSTGALQWVTQLGTVTHAAGGNNDDQDFCSDIALDSSGNIYCSGYTNGSMAEPNGGGTVLGSGYDIFTFKLNSSGALQYITQLGTLTHKTGRTNYGDEMPYGVAVNDNGNVYIAGKTGGSIAATNAGDYDIFAIKLDPR